MDKIKVAMITSNLGLHGISNIIINYCINMDINKFEITIFTGNPIAGKYKSICDKYNIKIVELPKRKPNFLKYYYCLLHKMNKNYFDILHVHGNSTTMYFELLVGKIKKIKIRIAHCHAAKSSYPKINRLLWKRFQNNYDYGLACSKLAGEYIFEKDYEILINGFNIKEFIYDDYERKKIRNNLKIFNEAIVIGHSGRFDNNKNQEFLVDIFETLYEKNNAYYLLLVGDGPKFDEVKEKVDNLKCKSNVIFLGEIPDTSKIYSAMDIFVFPSIAEGLGLSLLEAQVSGLNCISSDTVPLETNITENVTYISLDNKQEWINTIEKLNHKHRNSININDKKIEKYNIFSTSKNLERIYLNLIDRKE